ncbi:mediator of RNA polymerase II transcription subunit 15 isoform X3 [Lucilia sericata]|uniref:mediator of RNA polymerase II transcription subunit 15 isoform X3 n=1 Tax=Lucilia sericata TaxID=13632 RepID=UPI0018A7FD30|nr:mediator of RNA polymerase II transcription subunit 15 isoform X3 [Lucilia sericata]
MESTSEVVPNSVADKSVCVEDLPENTKTVEEAEVTITIKEHVVGENDKTKIVEETVTEKLKEEDDEEEIEEIVEEEVENNDEEVEEGVTQKITEKVIDNPDGGQTKTITVTTVKKVTPDGTKTVVTTTSSTKETPTIITTTPPTPTTEEVKTETTTEAPIEKTVKKQVSEEKKVEHNEHEEEEEEEIEEEEEEEDEEEEEEAEIVNEEESRKPVEETKKSDESSQQQEQHDQISSEAESQPSIATPLVKEQTVTDAPSAETKTNQQENVKQDNLNNTIKDIISSIDSNIQAEENFAHLKEMELELLKKQQELAKEIEQQKLLAQKLANENQIKQQLNKNLAQQETYQPTTNVSKYETFEEKQDENVYTRKSEKIETRESTNVTKKIDLHKIFTPATDAEEILPKNRKLYASSAFYSPTLHPTVEDQVELARRISHSLSDISNHQSRGQSMYVNRKKRSVKWVHEGCGQEDETENVIITNQEEKENNVSHHEKVPLKFLMNPYGQMRDINSLRESINTETGLLSPDVSAEVVTALQAQTGKDYHQYQQQPRPSTSPSILPAYTDAAKHRVQLNLHQEQLLEKYAKPGLKVVQTPWEAALNSGSASAAFVEEQKLSSYPNTTLTPSPTPQFYDANQGGAPLQSAPTVSDSYSKPYSNEDYQNYQTYAAPRQQGQNERQQYSGTNSQRELAYKPSIPQGWKAPSMSLPKVEYGHQSNIEINLMLNEIRQVNEDTKSCEEFSTTDETELVNLICDNHLHNATHVSKHTLSTEEHQFVNHLIKSPELRVSPIPISTQVIYDNAVLELQMKQQQQLSHKHIEICDKQDENDDEKEEKVNVRKQLQQYEDLHRQFAKQIEQEELLQKKHEAAKLKALQNNIKKLTISNSNQSIIGANVTNGSPQTDSQQITQQQQQEEEDYIKIPVKELITNFEQQCLQDEKLNTQPAPSLKDNLNLELEKYVDKTEITKNNNEDLYMPKEIPLQSYAPPPAASMPASVSPPFSTNMYESNQFNTYKPQNASPLSPYSVPEPAPAMNSSKPYGGTSSFPISKPYQQGFSSSYGGNNQPPKQQYLPPQSYQTIPQSTSQNAPQVSFNPSPLPYDKLAKFENPPADEGRYISSPPSRGSHLNVRGSKVRNVSPAPFAGSYNRPYTPSSDNHYYSGTPSPSPRPLSSLQHSSGHNTPNLTHPTVTSNQILNAPSYNNSARGWGCNSGTSTGYQHPQSHISANKPQIINTASMPYTDF